MQKTPAQLLREKIEYKKANPEKVLEERAKLIFTEIKHLLEQHELFSYNFYSDEEELVNKVMEIAQSEGFKTEIILLKDCLVIDC